MLNHAFPNGTVFAYTLPATSGTVSHVGDAVSGDWAGAGSFRNSADLSTFALTLVAPELGVSGTLEIHSDGPSHFGCNSTTSPYFESAVPSDIELSANEEIFFKRLGWATSQPDGAARVSVSLGGSDLSFAGVGYHDQNWMLGPADASRCHPPFKACDEMAQLRESRILGGSRRCRGLWFCHTCRTRGPEGLTLGAITYGRKLGSCGAGVDGEDEPCQTP